MTASKGYFLKRSMLHNIMENLSSGNIMKTCGTLHYTTTYSFLHKYFTIGDHILKPLMKITFKTFKTMQIIQNYWRVIQRKRERKKEREREFY